MTIINDREFSLILPKWDNDQHRINPRIIKEFADEMSEHFGGVTIKPTVLGCWVNKQDKLQCEENLVLSSFRDSESTQNFNEQIRRDEQFMSELSKNAGIKLGQDSVVFSENINEVTFEDGKFKPALPKRYRGIDFFEKLI